MKMLFDAMALEKILQIDLSTNTVYHTFIVLIDSVFLVWHFSDRAIFIIIINCQVIRGL